MNWEATSYEAKSKVLYLRTYLRTYLPSVVMSLLLSKVGRTPAGRYIHFLLDHLVLPGAQQNLLLRKIAKPVLYRLSNISHT